MSDLSLHPRELLAEYAEGGLTPEVRARLGAHLGACRTCLDETARWRLLYGALHRLPSVPVPGGLSDRILFAVARERARRHRVATWLGRATAALSWGYVAGAAVFTGLGLGVLLVPAWRDSAARAMAYASGEALRIGLGFLDLSAGAARFLRDGAGDLWNRAEWLSAIGRALEAALNQQEIQVLLLGGASATLLLFLVLLAGGSGRRARWEVPHAGFLVV